MTKSIRYLLIPFLLLIFPGPLSAERNTSYLDVKYIENYDGDSITFDIPDAPPIMGKDMVISLRGIDTPELKRSKCEQEEEIAMLAKNRVHSLLKDAKVVNLHRTGRGKYFRILADIEFDGRDLATILLKEELAVPYFGGTRDHDWCSDTYSPSQPGQRGPSILPPGVNGVYVWPPPPQQE